MDVAVAEVALAAREGGRGGLDGGRVDRPDRAELGQLLAQPVVVAATLGVVDEHTAGLVDQVPGRLDQRGELGEVVGREQVGREPPGDQLVGGLDVLDLGERGHLEDVVERAALEARGARAEVGASLGEGAARRGGDVVNLGRERDRGHRAERPDQPRGADRIERPVLDEALDRAGAVDVRRRSRARAR